MLRNERNERLAHKLAAEYWAHAHSEVRGDYSPASFAINLDDKVKVFLKEKKAQAGFLQSIIISLVTKMVTDLVLDWLLDGLTQPPPYKEAKE